MNNQNLLQRAENLAETGQRQKALHMVREAATRHPRNCDIWWAMGQLSDNADEQFYALKIVLLLCPDYPHINDMLARVQKRKGSNSKRQPVPFLVRKSYISPAFITLLAYIVFFPTGIALNLYYVHQIRILQKLPGVGVSAGGCIYLLMSAGVIIAAGFVLSGIVGLASIMELLPI